MKTIESNRTLNLDNAQKIAKIQEICDKYKSVGSKRKIPTKQTNTSKENIDSTLSRHDSIYNEIMERIQQSILMGVEELGLSMKLPDEIHDDLQSSDNEEKISNHALSSDDEDPVPRPAQEIKKIEQNDFLEEEEDNAFIPDKKLPASIQFPALNKNNADEEEDIFVEEESDDDVFVEESAPSNIVRRK